MDNVAEPEKRLSDLLMKVQVLAVKLESDKLQEWASNELNGYRNRDCPDYRIIGCAVYGNLLQNAGFGSYNQRKGYPLPIEQLDVELQERLTSTPLIQKVSELEKLAESDGDLAIDIPYKIQALITKNLKGGWTVDSAWQRFEQYMVGGVLSAIRNKLLAFMIELHKEFPIEPISKVENRSEGVDEAFDNTIGTISAGTVNISMGAESLQTISSGTNARLNVAKGDNLNQSITEELESGLTAFVQDLKNNLGKLGLDENEVHDIEVELTRVESQLEREQPRKSVLTSALEVIKGILTRVAANELTPVLIDQINLLVAQF